MPDTTKLLNEAIQSVLHNHHSELVQINARALHGAEGVALVNLSGDLQSGHRFVNAVLMRLSWLRLQCLLIDARRADRVQAIVPALKGIARFVERFHDGGVILIRENENGGDAGTGKETGSETRYLEAADLISAKQELESVSRYAANNGNPVVSRDHPINVADIYIFQEDFPFNFRQTRAWPHVGKICLDGAIDYHHLGSLLGIGKFYYDAGFPVLHFDLANAADIHWDLAEEGASVSKVKLLWGQGAELVVLSNYKHCPRLALQFLSIDQPLPDGRGFDHGESSCRFIALDDNPGAEALLALPQAPGELIEHWIDGATRWQSGGIAPEGPVKIALDHKHQRLILESCEEQRCPTCSFSLWEEIRSRLLGLRGNRHGQLIGPSGCYECPECGKPIILAFDGTILAFHEPAESFSAEFLQRRLARL